MTSKYASVLDAAKDNQANILKVLLENAGEEKEKLLKKKDEDGRTPFHWACSEGSTDAVKVMLEYTDEILNWQDDTGRSPLMSATAAGRLPVVKCLLSAKANANLRTKKGQIALHYHKGNIAVLEALIPQTTNLDRADKYSSTPLARAVSISKLEAVEFLTHAKADVNIVDSEGDTLLHIAASNKDDEMAKFLISKGVDREILNKDGKKAEQLRGL